MSCVNSESSNSIFARAVPIPLSWLPFVRVFLTGMHAIANQEERTQYGCRKCQTYPSLEIPYRGVGYSQYDFSIFIGFFDHYSCFIACLALGNHFIPYKLDRNENFQIWLEAQGENGSTKKKKSSSFAMCGHISRSLVTVKKLYNSFFSCTKSS